MTETRADARSLSIGVPLNDTSILRLQIAELGESILGNNLIGLQIGNEPDLYFNNRNRPPDYSVQQYSTEWAQVVQQYIDDSSISNHSCFIAPSVCCGGSIGWHPEQVWDTGFLDNYKDYLAYISVQR